MLSGGELSRLKLCILMDEEVNLLILDEPTNHLDIASREWIEEAVESYDGTLLFVSHDRYFINRFATRVWELENGVITDYPMGFARYRQVKALEAQNKIDHTPKAVKEKTLQKNRSRTALPSRRGGSSPSVKRKFPRRRPPSPRSSSASKRRAATTSATAKFIRRRKPPSRCSAS